MLKNVNTTPYAANLPYACTEAVYPEVLEGLKYALCVLMCLMWFNFERSEPPYVPHACTEPVEVWFKS